MQSLQAAGTRIADVTAAGTIGTAAVINLSQINMVVQIAAGCVAIVAGMAAAAFHIYRTCEIHRTRNSRTPYKDE